MNSTNEPSVLIKPLKSALIAGVAQKLPALVRVQAPDPDESPRERRPYHLALVIDRSGSMAGEPLAEAVHCARHIVSRLEPTDRAALVVFDDGVDTLVPARPVGDRGALYAALARIHEGGSTNLHGGWKAGVDALLPGAQDASLARVILLSDGNANAGETTDAAAIAALCAQAAARGVTTSTYGLGRRFNEELMVEMAKQGHGNPYYGATATDLFEPFAEEFDLIASLYARRLRLSLTAPEGVQIELKNDYPVEAREGFPAILLPDLPLGAEVWALVELKLPGGPALDDSLQVLQAGVTGATPDGVPIAFPETRLALKAVSPVDWEALPADPLVAARVAELEAAALLAQARAAAEHGDWKTIGRILADAQRRFANHPWLIEVLAQLAGLARAADAAGFRKEAMYSGRRFHSRVSAKMEAPADLAAEEDSPSFVRRRAAQGKAQFVRRPGAPGDGTDKPAS
jgi:Ca-activated chloride channel family protein